MKGRTGKLTASAILAALTLVFLYLASVLPTGQLGVVAVASLFSIAVVVEAGLVPAILVYVCCGLLSLLILPLKGAALLYILFFGYYPVVKSVAERIKRRALCWALKLAVFAAALSLCWFIFRALIFSGAYSQISPLIVYPAGLLVFALYDIGLSKLIWYYMARISPKYKRK